MPTADSVLVARDESIVTVTLNRPHRRNALDRAGWRRLADVFTDLDGDGTLRSIVVRGAGGRAFGAGADIAEFADERRDSTQAVAYGRDVDAAMGAITSCKHPTIALIEGVCVGGGLEIACACDLRVCSTSSRFGIPVNRLGLTMSHSELRVLLSVVATPIAKEVLFSGELFDAPRALQMGLVHRIVEDAGVEAETYALATRVAAAAPQVNRLHKKFIARLADPTPLTAAEIAEGYATFDSKDFARGYQAFLDKRDPEFEGD